MKELCFLLLALLVGSTVGFAFHKGDCCCCGCYQKARVCGMTMNSCGAGACGIQPACNCSPTFLKKLHAMHYKYGKQFSFKKQHTSVIDYKKFAALKDAQLGSSAVGVSAVDLNPGLQFGSASMLVGSSGPIVGTNGAALVGTNGAAVVGGTGPIVGSAVPVVGSAGPAVVSTGPAVVSTGPAVVGTGPAIVGTGPAIVGPGPACVSGRCGGGCGVCN